ncbi:unnamed protein product [Didymodactylos carnosus]|uniref:3-ketoacyl-[acyl-carrier-protein] reductase beta subunit n=1 Tax=Didymodactylos carnosus TaxID=1234261 RepID=A0A814JC71_9BILA|nr:unnamed protein product [Didymodactylos carnosus]CAF3806657.1 unnamed protein product [Didymodactylos carnosus]
MADLDTMHSIIEKEKGRLDIVFANAGIGTFVPLDSITEKQFDELFNINVKGVLFTVQKVLPLISEGGSIILNGSVSSIKAYPTTSLLSASKAAVRSFARCWTVDLKERKIRVDILNPGAIPTTAWDKAGFSDEMKKTMNADFLSAIPMNRFGMSDEIAKVAVFLASSDITGIELFVDGGMAQI